MSIDKRSLRPIYKLYKRALVGDNRCGTKHSHKRKQLNSQKKLRHKLAGKLNDVLISNLVFLVIS